MVKIPSDPRVIPPDAGISPYFGSVTECGNYHNPCVDAAHLRPNRYHRLVSFPLFGRPKQQATAVEEPIDTELTGYLAALAPESEAEITGGLRNSQVYQLRLSLVANGQLQELAQLHQTSPLALIQEWVNQRLAWESRQRPR